jgi:hypothetical protein
MKIVMKETVHGSLDGETVQKLEAGVTYDTIDSRRGVRLANYHVDQGVAAWPSRWEKTDEPAPVVRAPRQRKTRAKK